jgi:quercetin dioxygenase-like cupin family protein
MARPGRSGGCRVLLRKVLPMFPTVAAGPGVTRQVLTDAPGLMLVAVRFEAGAVGPPHSHPHIQATFVRSGRFRFTVAGAESEVGPGDTVTMKADEMHGCVCLEGGELIDAFTPRRDDFL